MSTKPPKSPRTADDFLDYLACTGADVYTCAAAIRANPSLVNARSDEDVTSLMFAVDNLEGITEMLLDHGADINAADNEQATALHWAARSGDESVVRILLSRGADWTMRDKDGKTPRDMASAPALCDIFDACAAGNPPPRIESKPLEEPQRVALALSLAAAEGDADKLHGILNRWPEAALWQEPYTGGTGLIAAAYYEKLDQDAVARLVEHGADPTRVDRFGATALSYAAEKKNGGAYAVLLARAADRAAIQNAIADAVTGGSTSAIKVRKPLALKR